MHWVNGQLTDSISLTDRSFQYGDGGFTTMRVESGVIQHWDKHRLRMESCLQALDIRLPDWQIIETWLESAIIDAPVSGLKLHVSRGVGGRGYSPTQVTLPNVTISAFQYPDHYAQWQKQGMVLGVCDKRLGINPMLAGHKHNNRLEQVLLKAEMDKAGFMDGLSLDVDGHVIETTMANVFWLKADQVYTPELKRSGVSGVMRRVVIDILSESGYDVASGNYTLDHVKRADEVFISNSILGVAPITRIGGRSFPIGTTTKSIQERVNP
ncbi:aminodeoxychorismate lyase [Vibrio ostreicida]|uniref:Aminodeoxychorismate lyase n=1 Tax=Vibrio ostreicida TaxID=526588 RepID=A0ABT8BWJ3_9VIBR|nr:aminodeoxychorismate lyase [Vibrio ostreicida]MDN3610505.1 aminodeoxychorismate lyase [Vibrio ostreicida]NPD07493.1 aminodeoxychorismate lyase [Vibrio ostreicida]